MSAGDELVIAVFGGWISAAVVCWAICRWLLSKRFPR